MNLKTVTFKSWSPYFEVEQSDMKNNTTRDVMPDDPRYKILKRWVDGKEKLGFVNIKHTASDKQFLRLLVNVSLFGESKFTLTWFPDCEHDWIFIDKWHDSKHVHYEFHCRYCLKLNCKVFNYEHNAPC